SAARAFERIANPADDRYATWQMATLATFLDALEHRGSGLKKLQAEPAEAFKEALRKLDGLLDYARKTAESPGTGEPDRLQAIRLLGRGPRSQAEDATRLGAVLQPQFSAPLQRAALDRLEQIDDPEVGRTLLASWRNY